MTSSCWAFTNYNLAEDYELIWDHGEVIYMIVGREKGKENGKWHDQGYLQLKRPRAMLRVKGWFADGKTHLESAIASQQCNKVYCGKDDKEPRVWGEPKKRGGARKGAGGCNEHTTKHQEIRANLEETDIETFDKGGAERIKAKHYAIMLEREAEVWEQMKLKFGNITLNKYQAEMWKRLSAQNDRQITWVFDPEGNIGKTWFARWMQVIHNAVFATSGKSGDMMQSIYNQLAEGKKATYVVIDMVRSQDLVFNYTALENIKDGVLVKTKYNSRTIFLMDVKVIVLSNQRPQAGQLSDDRWDLLDIQKVFPVKTPWKP